MTPAIAIDYTGLAKKLYPDLGEHGYFCASDYQPIVDHFGTVVLQVEEEDYQGDTWVLYDDTGKGFGYLQFGWGSCSGCDALQGCDSYAEIGELIQQLEGSIRWAPRAELLKFFNEHDWQGDYSWREDELKTFVKDAIAYLESAPLKAAA